MLAYLTYTFLLVITPGSTTAVVIRNTLAAGWRGGLAAGAGAAVANTTYATAAGLGLIVLVSRSPGALAFVRIAGGVYLAWLGVTSLRNAVRRRSRSSVRGEGLPASGREAPRASFREGVTVNLLNPAIVTFYLVVVPSFLPRAAPRWYFAVLAATHVAMALACHAMWALAFDRVRHLFERPGTRQSLEAATGTALLALAARVLIQG